MSDSYSDTLAVDPAIVPAPAVTVEVPKEEIYVYASSIEPVSFSAESDVCPFDIALVVEVKCKDANGVDSIKTYKINKRIAFDKVKLLQNAMVSVPVTMVEGEKANAKSALKEHIQNMKTLAGL